MARISRRAAQELAQLVADVQRLHYAMIAAWLRAQDIDTLLVERTAARDEYSGTVGLAYAAQARLAAQIGIVAASQLAQAAEHTAAQAYSALVSSRAPTPVTLPDVPDWVREATRGQTGEVQP